MLWEVAEESGRCRRANGWMDTWGRRLLNGTDEIFCVLSGRRVVPFIEKPLFQTINDTILLRVTRIKFCRPKMAFGFKPRACGLSTHYYCYFHGIGDFCVSIKETKGTFQSLFSRIRREDYFLGTFGNQYNE